MSLTTSTALGLRRAGPVTLAALRNGRCTLLLLLTLLCLAVREEFLFSHFPMYSSFAKTTYYVYLADGTGQPLATLPLTGMTTPTLKKVYQTELQKEIRRLRSSRSKLTVDQKRPAGERVLASLHDSLWAQQQGDTFPPGLQLYEVNIALAGNGFEKRTDLIAETR